MRREYLDRMFFWNAVDLAQKLDEFRNYYNAHRVHRSLDGSTPAQRAGASSPAKAALDQCAWLYSIVAVSFGRRWQRECEFATHRSGRCGEIEGPRG
ncbi:MAG: integrase core domain-containing protein [Gammaproteobacteria bacterium]